MLPPLVYGWSIPGGNRLIAIRFKEAKQILGLYPLGWYSDYEGWRNCSEDPIFPFCRAADSSYMDFILRCFFAREIWNCLLLEWMFIIFFGHYVVFWNGLVTMGLRLWLLHECLYWFAYLFGELCPYISSELVQLICLSVRRIASIIYHQNFVELVHFVAGK